MAKNLRLVGLVSYTGVATTKNGVSAVIKRGDVARFSDEVAEKVLDGFRINREGQEVNYFEEVGDDVVPQHNFTDDPVKTEAPQVDALSGRSTSPRATAPRARQRRAAATA